MRHFLFFYLCWILAAHSNEMVKGDHLQELRSLADQKRFDCGLPLKNWTDSILISRQTPIKAVHIMELRQTVNELLNTATWTDSVLVKGLVIKKIHFQELKSQLNLIECPSWKILSTGACTGGSGNWVYSPWGNCSGGSTSYLYGAWGVCSATCGGGSQTRSYTTCSWNANSGQESRNATCEFNENSGSQMRSVACQKGGVTLPDNKCVGAKPSTVISCTPSNSSVCGVKGELTQSCTPTTSNPVCGTPVTAQTCNTQSCCMQTYEDRNVGFSAYNYSFTHDLSPLMCGVVPGACTCSRKLIECRDVTSIERCWYGYSPPACAPRECYTYPPSFHYRVCDKETCLVPR